MIQPDAEDAFKKFAENNKTVTWDGNFRELNAMITRMVILSGDRIEMPIVLEETEKAIARYSAKTEAPVEEHPHEATPQTARSILGNRVYDSLSPIDKAEVDCILRIVTEGHITSQKELCQKAYGGKISPNGGLGKHLRKNFGLAFSHGRLERVGKAAT